jgi:hypothetical protein
MRRPGHQALPQESVDTSDRSGLTCNVKKWRDPANMVLPPTSMVFLSLHISDESANNNQPLLKITLK